MNKAQKKRAADLETIRAQYYNENLGLRADLYKANQEKEKLLKENQGMKQIINDEQLLRSIMLWSIKQLTPPQHINTMPEEPK